MAKIPDEIVRHILDTAINRGYLIETAMKQNGYPMLDVAGDLPF